MAKRLGAVIKFKEGVSKQQAIEALRTIKGVLDVPEKVLVRMVMCKSPAEAVANAGWVKESIYRPFTGNDLVKEYEADHGEPIWYIP